MLKKVCNWWSIVYILLLTMVLPVYVEDSYFNILQAKSHCFVCLSFIMLPIGIVLFLIAYKSDGLKTLFRNPLDIAIAALGLIALVSTLCSSSISESLWGEDCYGTGSMTIICCVIAYFLISRCFIYTEKIWLPIFGINFFICLFAILHAAGLDIFSMHENMLEGQIYGYYSTIGQCNFWVAYLCILIPINIVLILNAKNTRLRVFYKLFWMMLSFALLVTGTDGIYLGLGILVFFLIPYILKDNFKMEHTGWLLAILGACELFYSLIPAFQERISQLGDGIAMTLSTPIVGAILIAVGVLWIWLSHTFWGKTSDKVRKIIIWILEILLAILVIIYFIKTVGTFNDDWGTGRGYIWRNTLERFADLPFINKIIGVGPEVTASFYSGLEEGFNNVTILNAHSEPLHYLVTVGILGLIAWIGFWVSSIVLWRKSVKKGINNPMFFFALMAYMGQSLVNVIMTIGLVMLFLAFAWFYIVNVRSCASYGEVFDLDKSMIVEDKKKADKAAIKKAEAIAARREAREAEKKANASKKK